MGTLAWFFVLAVAIVVAFFAGRMSAPRTARLRNLERERDAAAGELRRYQEEVNSHFETTGKLFDRLTGDYRQLYEHLSQGAQKLGSFDHGHVLQSEPERRRLGTGKAAAGGAPAAAGGEPEAETAAAGAPESEAKPGSGDAPDEGHPGDDGPTADRAKASASDEVAHAPEPRPGQAEVEQAGEAGDRDGAGDGTATADPGKPRPGPTGEEREAGAAGHEAPGDEAPPTQAEETRRSAGDDGDRRQDGEAEEAAAAGGGKPPEETEGEEETRAPADYPREDSGPRADRRSGRGADA